MKKVCAMACWLLLCSACFKVPLDRSLKLGKPIADFPIEKVPVKGVNAAVRTRARAGGKKLEGELLAADGNFIWILQAGRPVRVAKRDVREVELRDLFGSGAGALGLWTALGTVSTVSHYLAAIVTAPIWLAIGIPVSVSAAESNDLTVERDNFDLLNQWARFPQGMPMMPAKPPPGPTPVVAAANKTGQPRAQPAPPAPALAELCPPLPGGDPSCGAFLVQGQRALWAVGRASEKGDGAIMRRLAAMRARERLVRMIAPEATGKRFSIDLAKIEVIDRWRNEKEGAYYAVVVLVLAQSDLDADTATRLFTKYSQKKGDGVDSKDEKDGKKTGTE